MQTEILTCPHCDSDYSHILGVGTLTGTDPYEAVSAYPGTLPIGKTGARRSAVEVVCRCEQCQRNFSLVIQQHKGVNSLERQFTPTGDVRSRAWTCHQCGSAIGHVIIWMNQAGCRHLFCDNDCLRQWIEDRLVLTCHRARRECVEADQAIRQRVPG